MYYARFAVFTVSQLSLLFDRMFLYVDNTEKILHQILTLIFLKMHLF
jgi:hypothetical protein